MNSFFLPSVEDTVDHLRVNTVLHFCFLDLHYDDNSFSLRCVEVPSNPSNKGHYRVLYCVYFLIVKTHSHKLIIIFFQKRLTK